LRIRALGRTVRTAVCRTVGIIFVGTALAYPVAAIAAAADRILPRSYFFAVQVPGRLLTVHAQGLLHLSAVIVLGAFAGLAAFDIRRRCLAVGGTVGWGLAHIAHAVAVAC